MVRGAHFEIPADKPERATEFHKQVFGWTVRKWDGPQDYWLVSTGNTGDPGIDGAIVKRESAPMTANTFRVASGSDYLKKAASAGGRCTSPKMVIPGYGYMVYCADTEGNQFGIMQMDPQAK